jgi:hypothetical protein
VALYVIHTGKGNANSIAFAYGFVARIVRLWQSANDTTYEIKILLQDKNQQAVL